MLLLSGKRAFLKSNKFSFPIFISNEFSATQYLNKCVEYKNIRAVLLNIKNLKVKTCSLFMAGGGWSQFCHLRDDINLIVKS